MCFCFCVDVLGEKLLGVRLLLLSLRVRLLLLLVLVLVYDVLQICVLGSS